MPLRKIEKQSLSQSVFEQLKTEILNGTWQPGDRLPSENALATEIGVSRVTIRAAIQRLQSLGLVESKQGNGNYVCKMRHDDTTQILTQFFSSSEADISDFLRYRSILEPGMAYAAAQNATDEDIAELSRIVRKYYNLIEDDADSAQIIATDISFHTSIATATHNAFAIKVYNITIDLFSENLVITMRKLKYKSAIKYHKVIFKALKAHDADAARQAMQDHIDSTMQLLIDYESSPADI